MAKERLNPLNDYLFLKIMGEKGDEEQLCAFLNAVLGRERDAAIVSVEIIDNRTITAEVIGDKTNILDVRAITAAGERVEIEVQLQNLGNMDRRSLFYWSREFSTIMEAGQDYRDLPKVIAINIVNYEFIKEKISEFHLSFHIWEDTHRILLTDAFEIHFIDMVKFRRTKEKDIRNEPLHRWLIWLDKDSPEGLVEEAIGMDAAIQKAEEKMVHVSMDKEALRAYQMREMALSDLVSGINHARREGMEEGIKEGMREGVKEGMKEGMREGMKEGVREGELKIARNLKKIGMPVEQISQVTDLSAEEITKL
jgi:predicted transposase/invertase (TIGR01784 family)